MQTTLDFNKPISRICNNAESTAHEAAHAKHFSAQCATVYAHLLTGKFLTTRDAMIQYGICALQRRIKDLRDIHKIEVKDRWVDNSYKEYYIDLKTPTLPVNGLH